MERTKRWAVVGAGVALVVVSLLAIRAGLQPCAWLDVALKRSGCLRTVEKRDTAVDSVAFSPDGSLVALSSRDGKVRVWRVADSTLVHTLVPPDASEKGAHSYDIAFSPDGTLLALGLPDGTVRLWRVAAVDTAAREFGPEAQTPFLALHAGAGAVCSLDFSPDGRFLASGSASGVIQLWEVADGELAAAVDTAARENGLTAHSPGRIAVRELSEHAGQVLGVAFSPTGALLASTSLDGTTALWQVADGLLLHSVDKDSVATGVAFSPDGSMLAVDREVWSVEEWAPIREMRSTKGGMGNVAFSPDGSVLAAGNAWYEVRWWRVADGALLHVVEGHTDSVNSVAFSPDGNLLVSGSLDGTVRLWRVPGATTD